MVMEKGVIVEQGASLSGVKLPSRNILTHKRLVNSQPPFVRWLKPPADAPILMQAKDIARVQYPIRRAGWQGWFRGDQFTRRCRMPTFHLRARPNLGRDW
jgi:microcin C transport system ATP-binding protein